MSAETNALISASRCIDSCIPDGMKLAVIIYLLSVYANVDYTDTNSLIRSARCIDSCVPTGAIPSIIVKLLQQIAEASGAGCGMLSDSGDPTGVVTPEFIGQLYHDTTADTYYYSTGTTSADWTAIGGAPVACANKTGAGDPT